MNVIGTLVLMCTFIPSTCLYSTFGKSFFNPRSQSSNMARWLACQADDLYKPSTIMNGSLFFTPQYGQTTNAEQLAEYIFFNGTPSIIFGPSASNAMGVTNPLGQATDVFSPNFFLNNDFESNVTAAPTVKNTTIDINFYLHLSAWLPGLFTRIDIPFGITSWALNLEETILNPGTSIAAETFGNFADTPSPLSSAIQAWNGQTLDIDDFPQLKQKLQFARVDGAQKKIGFADLTFMLGYHFYLTEKGHFGLSAATIIPLEDRPSPEFLFTPVLGNGGYTEAGLGITGHYMFWQNAFSSCAVYLEGVIYHVLSSHQKRTFDLNNDIASRYLLLKKFSTTDPFTYDDEIIFGPNITTLECSVHNAIHADIALMIAYHRNSVTLQGGYNIWARSKDIITLRDSIQPNTYGIQGATRTADESINFTQSLSSIKGSFAPPLPGDMVSLTTQDINIDSAQHPHALTHKLFGNIRYTWNCTTYFPFIGIGGEYEMCFNNNAFNQWGVWITGGFSFA